MSTNLPAAPAEIVAPLPIDGAGKRTLLRFVEFFTVHISNANTRQAYARALKSFLGWCAAVFLVDLRPDTTYYFRAIGVNAFGTALGETLSFRTPRSSRSFQNSDFN